MRTEHVAGRKREIELNNCRFFNDDDDDKNKRDSLRVLYYVSTPSSILLVSQCIDLKSDSYKNKQYVVVIQ